MLYLNPEVSNKWLKTLIRIDWYPGQIPKCFSYRFYDCAYARIWVASCDGMYFDVMMLIKPFNHSPKIWETCTIKQVSALSSNVTYFLKYITFSIPPISKVMHIDLLFTCFVLFCAWTNHVQLSYEILPNSLL